MKTIAVIHLGDSDFEERVTFLDEEIAILRRGCGGEPERARALLKELDGTVDAIGLEGLPGQLQLGSAQKPHSVGATLAHEASQTPVVDGDGIRAGLERWAVILADRAEPGIFAEKRVLMAPGMNHSGSGTGISSPYQDNPLCRPDHLLRPARLPWSWQPTNIRTGGATHTGSVTGCALPTFAAAAGRARS